MVCFVAKGSNWKTPPASCVRISNPKPGVVRVQLVNFCDSLRPDKTVRACVVDGIVPLLLSDLPKNLNSGSPPQIELSYSGKFLLTSLTDDRSRDLQQLINWPVWNEIYKKNRRDATIFCRLNVREAAKS